MADILHTLTSGQSLSIGGSGSPSLSTVSEELNAYAIGSSGFPAALTNATNQFPHLSMGYTLARTRPLQKLGFSTHGQGSMSIAALSPGGSTGKFEEAIARVQAGRDYAVARSTSYALEPVIHWIQGEEDSKLNTPAATYLASLTALRQAYIDQIHPITGQDLSGLAWVMSQTASWAHPPNGAEPRIGLAQLQAARTLPNFYVIGGQYQFPYADSQHMTNVGYYRMGELHARAHQAVIDGLDWRPFAPREYVVTPAYVDVVYDVPSGALEFDTTTVPAQPAMGFSLPGSSASITHVALVGEDTVRLLLSQPITEPGTKVGYGVSSSIGGVGVGNLCDGEAATSHYDGARIANWALHSLDALDIEGSNPVAFNVTAAYLTGAGGNLYPVGPVLS